MCEWWLEFYHSHWFAVVCWTIVLGIPFGWLIYDNITWRP